MYTRGKVLLVKLVLRVTTLKSRNGNNIFNLTTRGIFSVYVKLITNSNFYSRKQNLYNGAAFNNDYSPYDFMR